jgi:hypothetical protein
VRIGPSQPKVSRSEIYQNPSKNQSRSVLLREGWRATSSERPKVEGGEQPRAAARLVAEDGATPQ